VKTDITVAISIYNAEKYIHACVKSLLAQAVKNFEIVIVEDPHFRTAKNIIDAFEDKRIRYELNRKHLGLSKSRNKCIALAKGDYIFFTDADCVVSKNWIEQGLKSFREQDCVGVEGKTYYVSEKYQPTFSDSSVANKKGGQFMTCNIAYKKSVIKNIGDFDGKYTYMEDRDLALRAMEVGKIHFNPEMIVYHQKVTLKPIQFVKQAKHIRNRVLLYKKFQEKAVFNGRIVYPLNLMAIIFPPLILVSLFRHKYSSKEDFDLLPFIYLRLIYERLSLWDMCIRERVFLI
jgi:GT2 family glycosyltransferase